jgi:hypothetical protein
LRLLTYRQKHDPLPTGICLWLAVTSYIRSTSKQTHPAVLGGQGLYDLRRCGHIILTNDGK